ncbi:MAG: type II secretion system F family protein [Bacillota bacterium]
MHFRYRAYQASGRQERGVLEAPDLTTARARLRALGFYPLEVRPVPPPRPRRVRIAVAEAIFLYRQLGFTLKAGLPLLDALRTLRQEARSRAFRTALAEMEARIAGGSDFSDALAALGGAFQPLHVELIRAGEATGRADEALLRCAALLEAEKDLRDQVAAALVYPAFVVGVGLLALVTAFLFILPRLADLFASLEMDLPAPTRILMALGTWSEAYGAYGALALAALAGLTALITSATPWGRRLRDRALLRLPLAGRAVQAAALARFARTLAETVASDLPANRALTLAVGATGNTYLEARLAEAQRRVLAGQGLAGPLAASGLIPGLFVQAIRAAEESGTVPEVLRHLASHYEAEARRQVRIATAALEPTLTVAMAAAVLFFAAAVVLPIFRMTTSIQP